MGVRIMCGDGDGDSQGACLYCSTTDWAFGPIFPSREAAELFLKVKCEFKDPREMSDPELSSRFVDFCTTHICECGMVRDEQDAEMKASREVPDYCTCESSGDGDCARCQAKQKFLDQEPAAGERFECVFCMEKREKKEARRAATSLR